MAGASSTNRTSACYARREGNRPVLLPKRYHLKNGNIYWHKLYFDLVPRWMTRYSPPGGFYNYAAYAYKPWEYVGDLYLQAKWFVQRGLRGYSDEDTWSLDHYLASWMPQALRQLKQNSHGHPDGMTYAGWQTRLRKMADGFEAAHALNATMRDWSTKEGRALQRKFQQGMKLFQEHYFKLWD